MSPQPMTLFTTSRGLMAISVIAILVLLVLPYLLSPYYLGLVVKMMIFALFAICLQVAIRL